MQLVENRTLLCHEMLGPCFTAPPEGVPITEPSLGILCLPQGACAFHKAQVASRFRHPVCRDRQIAARVTCLRRLGLCSNQIPGPGTSAAMALPDPQRLDLSTYGVGAGRALRGDTLAPAPHLTALDVSKWSLTTVSCNSSYHACSVDMTAAFWVSRSLRLVRCHVCGICAASTQVARQLCLA